MREERSDIALGVKLVSLLSAIEKDRYGTLSCDFTPHGVTIFGAFGAQIPEKPELPDDDKSPAELGIPCGEYEERRDEILSPWREEIFSVIEHSFAGMGIPLKS
jgi:hypothetical protein